MALALAGMYTRPYNNWSCALDFKRSYYKLGNTFASSFQSLPGATFTRPGEQLSYNPVTGKWQTFATDVPAIFSGAGMDIPEGTTNKCINYNAAPTTTTGVSKIGDAAATLTVVDDTAALRAAGFGALIDAGKMNGNVYKLDNSAGSGDAYANFAGNPGNTNTQTFSVFRRGGTGAINMGSAYPTGLPSSAAYQRETLSCVPTNSTTVPYLRADIGQVVYFILNQLEEKTYATNPVIVAGASASRGAATPVVTGLSSILTPPFTLVAVANLSALDGVDRELVSLSQDGNNPDRVTLARSAANAANFIARAGNVTQQDLSVAGKSGPRLLKMAYRIRSGTAQGAVDGALQVSAAITTPPLNRMDLGDRLGGSRWLNSPLLFAGIAPDLTDAQLQAITASNGSLMDFL